MADLEVSDDPEVLFYSVFGQTHWEYDCFKVAFHGENVRNASQLFAADSVMGFDTARSRQEIRWPLYKLAGNPFDLAAASGSRRLFCATVVSNPSGSVRNKFWDKLDNVRHVDSGGQFRNNVGGPVSNKQEFLSAYRFSIAFENASYPGYVTEKLLEAKAAGTVPIYFGSPTIYEDFEAGSFINLHDFSSIDDCIRFVCDLDDNPIRYEQFRQTPLVGRGVRGPYADDEPLQAWFSLLMQWRRRRLRSPRMNAIAARWASRRTQEFDLRMTRAFIDG